jgi:superfamily I DNA/RNA helicase
LIQSGVNVSNRVYAFKKNYRNTREILTAAYGLIQAYEFADVDEDNIMRPMEPEFAARHGEKPVLVKCYDREKENRFVATLIHKILEETKQTCQICVIAANQDVRDRIATALNTVKVPWAWLKDDSSLSSDVVKISTIESAKGHEFTHVFIPGLQERILPRGDTEHELPREAARLYVAMTRARDNLYLSYTSTHDLTPSRFLAAVQLNCTELVWNGYTLEEL